jgi:hypothetical protein
LEQQRPRGFLPVGLFFVFGAFMAAYASITLLFPGSPLDGLWAINKQAHVQLSTLGRMVGFPFLVVSLALALAALGWFRRRRWGWILGTSIIAVNAFGDLVNLVIGERLKGSVGIVIAGSLLFYLFRPIVRMYFD